MVLLATIAGGFYLSNKFVFHNPSPRGDGQYAPDIEATKATLRGDDEQGRKLWEMRAESITIHEDLGETKAFGVEISFFKDGVESLTAKADKLKLFHRSRNIVLEGSISARDNEGLKFYTEKMSWDAERELLEGDFEVRIEQKNNTLTGIGFEYSPKEGRLKVKREAHLEMTLEEGAD